jgi:hypothetical protein
MSDEWLLLEAEIEGMPHFVGIMPSLPLQEVRSNYPCKVSVSVDYEATENGLPVYEDDLQALNQMEKDFRSWDENQDIFLNAMRETGDGTRTWTFYAKSLEAFKGLVPENDFIYIEGEDDPEWTSISRILQSIR